MLPENFKHLVDYYEKEPLRVLFIFECPNCKLRKGIYDNGEEKVRKPDLCPKCKKELTTTHKEKDEVDITITKCKSCGYKEVEKYDFGKSRRERESQEAKDKK